MFMTLMGLWTVIWLGESQDAMGEMRVTKQLTVAKGKTSFKLECPILVADRQKVSRLLQQSDKSELVSVLWIVLGEIEMVGSSVEYNRQKYNYNPSTGELAIRNIGYEDAGIYKCVVKYGISSDGSGRRETKSSTIQLFVSRPYENLWEEEYKDNLTRALICSTFTFTVLTCLCVVHKYRWRQSINFTRHISEEQDSGNGLRFENCGAISELRRKWNRSQQLEESSFCGSEISACDLSPLPKPSTKRHPTYPPSLIMVDSDGSAIVPAVVHVTRI